MPGINEQRSKDILGIVEKPISVFEKYRKCEIDVELLILDECFQKLDDSIETLFPSYEAENGYDLNSFKVAGILCFWLRKLKPFKVLNEDANAYTKLSANEILSFMTGYYFIFGYMTSESKKKVHTPKISDRFFCDLIRSLRYNSHSPHSMAFMFEGLCI